MQVLGKVGWSSAGWITLAAHLVRQWLKITTTIYQTELLSKRGNKVLEMCLRFLHAGTPLGAELLSVLTFNTVNLTKKKVQKND